jgi:hypothetical protein
MLESRNSEGIIFVSIRARARMRLTFKTIATALISAFLLGMASSCSGHHKTPAQGAVQHSTQTTTIQDALSELDALEKPEGVDAELWGELKGALREALLCRAGTCAPPSGDSGKADHGGPQVAALQRITSSPPSGPANRVQDLTATRETNGNFTLTWHYRNIGDYDQNGAVGVSDLSPLAMHFGETYDTATEGNSIQAVIDGSGNGKIGVEDITQIAQYFASKLAQYSVQGGDQQQGPFTQTTTMQLPAEGRSDARLAFALNLGDQPAYTYWRVVPMDGEGGTGDASNVVVLNVEAPVRVLGVTPLSGLAGAEVTFTAFVTGTGPFTYEWDFGDGATPTTSTDAQPTVTLSTTEGPHPAHVKVTGATGSVTYPFTLTVTTLPGNPPIINTIGPFAGLSGEQLNFTADVDGDEPRSYSGEVDGGASPPVSSEVSPTTVLSRGGTLPAPDIQYPCRLTVYNDFGTASASFTLTVTAQWHVQDLPPLPDRGDYIWSNSTLDMAGILRGVYYYDSTPDTSGDGEARLLKYEVGQWSYERIMDGGLGYCSLAFNSSNEPGITYSLETPQLTGPLKYIHKTGGSWSDSELVFAGGIFATGSHLFYDSLDRPVIYYGYRESETSIAIKVARRTPEGWEARDAYSGPAMLGHDDKLVIATNDGHPQQALLYRENADSWDSNVIIEVTQDKGTAYPRSIAIDKENHPHILVHGGTDIGYVIATETDPGTFTYETVGMASPEPSWGGWNPCIAASADDDEYVLFTSNHNDTLTDWIAFKGSSGWELQTIPILIPQGSNSRYLLVDSANNVIVVSTIQKATYW